MTILSITTTDTPNADACTRCGADGSHVNEHGNSESCCECCGHCALCGCERGTFDDDDTNMED